MAHQLTLLYHHPDDAAAFDRYYDEKHIPLASTIPGLRTYVVSRPQPGPDGARPLYHQVATLTWDSADELAAALDSDVGKAALADIPNFTTAGADVLVGPAVAAI